MNIIFLQRAKIKMLKRAQSTVEYTMLIIIVAAALMVMTVYITRSINSRVKATEDEYNFFTGGD